ncbi:MAG: S-layer homology domain-containing protein [Acidaminococcaceae bacterium]|nr:S-layer homology domain-containing protein [Acidaminococcaceae bacterium]
MKKSLVLAMAMALGVTASAYAANPFSDVPAGHWAYDSISKLAAAGVIEGYGDDTFRGDRLMTRYEMAQIVARAMAKGANVDKLAAEFADELDKLNVRVAALEKKSDNVRVTGEARFHFAKYGREARTQRGKREHGIRTRVYLTGKVNDNWNYVARIQNQQWTHDYVGNEETDVNIAKLEGRLGGVNVTAGRDDDVIADGYIYDGEQDLIKLSYGDKWYVSGSIAKLTDMNDNVPNSFKKSWNVEAGTNTDGVVNGKIGYFGTDLGPVGKAALLNSSNLGIWYAGLNFKLGKDFSLDGMYLKGNRSNTAIGNIDDKGWVVGLSYKGAEASEPGTWGLAANYYHQGHGTYLQHTIDGYTDYNSGFKGWSFGGDVTVAKNMVLGITYYETKPMDSAIDVGAEKARVLWSEFNIFF